MSLFWFYWWVYSVLKVIKLYTLCATYCLSINTSIKLYKKQLTGKSILHCKTLYKSEHMAEVSYWKKRSCWSCCKNFFKNHTLSIFLWGLSVHREQKVSSTFKDLPLGGNNQLSKLNSTNFYRALIMCQTPSRAEKIRQVPCLYVPGNFIKRVKSLHKLEHSNCFPPSWEGGGKKRMCKGTKKGEKFSIWNKMVLNFC